MERIGEVATRRGISNAKVALAWVLQQPGIAAPIPGASQLSHLEDAVATLDVKLDEQDLKALAEPYRPRPSPGPQLAGATTTGP